jgi:hypothetical protein
MVFCLILFALCGIVAFFQYVQGFFSATISAIIAAIAAVVAMGWYESVAPLLFSAKMYDQAASISLVVIFAAVYIIPRLIIDAFVPGNVRVPFIVEKVGAGIAGLIVGLISTGIVAIAADALPFGSTVGMYSRFTTSDLPNLTYPGQNGPMQDTKANDAVQDDAIEPSKAHSVWLGQDDLVYALTRRVSADTGSLANDHPIVTVHPDLLDEYYAQRIGIQPGAKHTAPSTDQNQLVSVKGVYALQEGKAIPQIDGEPNTMRVQSYTPPPATVTPDPTKNQIVMVVRLSFSGKDLADDADGLIRYSASSLRLVAGRPDANIPMENFYPVATLDNKGIAVAARPDDFLFSDSNSENVDFVFLVDRDHVMGGDQNAPPFKLPDGTFVEFKRYGVVDLSGQTVQYGPPPNPSKTPVLRKPSVQAQLDKMEGIWTGASAITSSGGGHAASAGGGNASAAAPSGGAASGAGPSVAAGDHPLADSGLSFVDIVASNKLAVPINCGTGDDNATVQLPNGVGGVLTGRKWSQLKISADTPSAQLGTPASDNVQELATDPNTVLVQVHCSAPVSGSSQQIWAWGKRVADFEIADATGTTYPCVGVWATVQRGTDQYIAVDYKDFDDKKHLQPLPAQKGRPVDVWLAFQVPAGTPITELHFSGSTAMENLNFKAQ